MEAQQSLANDMLKRNQANAGLRHEAEANMPANSPTSGKEEGSPAQLDADLKEAKETKPPKDQGHDQSRSR